jgi:hypothetical protein
MVRTLSSSLNLRKSPSFRSGTNYKNTHVFSLFVKIHNTLMQDNPYIYRESQNRLED